MDFRASLIILYAVLEAVHGIMFHLQPNTVKCLREELQANVLVTGEYEISEAHSQHVDYTVSPARADLNNFYKHNLNLSNYFR